MKLTIFGATGRIGGHLLNWAVDAGHDVHVLARSPQALRPRDGLTVTGPIQAGARRTAGINKYSRSIRRILVLTLAAAVSLLAAAQHADAAQRAHQRPAHHRPPRFQPRPDAGKPGPGAGRISGRYVR